MKNFGTFLVNTALAGLLLLIPLSILFLVVMEIWSLLEDMAAFAALELPFPAFINGLIYAALVLLAIFVTCLTIGLLMKTRWGHRAATFVEKGIADKIPLLGIIRKLTLSLTGTETTLRPVEADIHGSGTAMWGFLMQTLDDGRHVVFVPTSPTLTLGHTYLLPPDRVKSVPGSVASVANALSQWGAGAEEIYAESGK